MRGKRIVLEALGLIGTTLFLLASFEVVPGPKPLSMRLTIIAVGALTYFCLRSLVLRKP